MTTLPRRRSTTTGWLILLTCVLAMTSSGCKQLNLWDGPNYRDDPVVSQIDGNVPNPHSLAD
ncbi:MAG: hypothetical protein NT069_35620 [Planctomycetota bacterium]|nr:hypothetical protein [Planctomycetota bacterium]